MSLELLRMPVGCGRRLRRIPGLRWPLLLLLLLGAGMFPAAAQDAAPAAGDTVVQPAAEPAPEAMQPTSDPLPAPRLDRAYTHVFLAFAIAWVLILGYVVALNRRVAAAERDLARLAERGG